MQLQNTPSTWIQGLQAKPVNLLLLYHARIVGAKITAAVAVDTVNVVVCTAAVVAAVGK